MEAFHSPFIVPVAAFLMVLGIVIVSKISEMRTRQMEYEERMAMIAKGLPLPPPVSSESARADGMMARWGHLSSARPGVLVRRWGIVLVAFGLGLALFFITLSWVLNERDVLAGAPTALIPFSIGVGLLIDAVIHKRELAAGSEA
jgi:hypothetical protein